MNISVGSKNQTKIQAVADTVLLYSAIFTEPYVVGIDLELVEFGHPKNLDQVVEGAVTRAKSAYINCAFSFGIESGLCRVLHSRSGFMEMQACAIYDGSNIHLGFAPAFEWPTEVTKLILEGELDGSAALRMLGITEEEKVGAVEGGAMGMLTYGRLTREEQIKTSIIAAMIQVERKDLYL